MIFLMKNEDDEGLLQFFGTCKMHDMRLRTHARKYWLPKLSQMDRKLLLEHLGSKEESCSQVFPVEEEKHLCKENLEDENTHLRELLATEAMKPVL